jgi:membrane fusion protein (multidrug efflux system)
MIEVHPKLLGLAGSVVITALLAGCSADATPVEKPPTVEPVAVSVGTARRTELRPSLATTARLVAVHEATVRTESAGDVIEVLVEEGDTVTEGQVLARLDRDRAAIRHRERVAQAQRSSARADRASTLAARGLASADALDTDATLAIDARLSVEISARDLADRDLRAPFAGVVARRDVKVGSRLGAGETAFAIVNPEVLRADIEVPERDLALLAVGQPARIVAPAAPDCRLDAVVAGLGAGIDPRSGTGSARVELVDSEARCRPGLHVRVEVEFAAIPDAVLVPRSAVIDDASGPAVFVIENDKALRKPVSIGIGRGAEVQIAQGLAGGERVITLGHQSLVSGDPVVDVRAAPVTGDAIARR